MSDTVVVKILVTVVFWTAIFLFYKRQNKAMNGLVMGSGCGTWFIFLFVVIPAAGIIILPAFLLPGVVAGVLMGVLKFNPQNIYEIHFVEGVWPWMWQVLLIIDVGFWVVAFLVTTSLRRE